MPTSFKRLPNPPVGPFNSESVDASGEAHVMGNMPDAALGLMRYAVTLVLALRGGGDRHRDHPWRPLVLAAKTAYDAPSGAHLTAEQASKHRTFCGYWLVGPAPTVTMFRNALPEAAAAMATVRVARQRDDANYWTVSVPFISAG